MKKFRISAVLLALVGCATIVLCLGAGDEDKKVNYRVVFVAAPIVVVDGQEAVNGEKFAQLIQEQVRNLGASNYVVDAVVPVVQGRYRWAVDQPVQRSQSASAFGYGYGFSVTSGVNIIAREQ